jgi:hypothetical protein
MDDPQLQPLHAPVSSTATKGQQVIRVERRIVAPRIVQLRVRRRMETELNIPGEKLPRL